MSESKLIELGYYDPSAKIRLSAYADTVVLDPDKKGSVICAIRFGGYPEMVRACLLYTSPSPRDAHESRMPSSA